MAQQAENGREDVRDLPNEPSESAWNAIGNEWPNGRHFVLNDHLAFVASETITTTERIAEQVGIDEAGGVQGIVIQVGANHGYNSTSLWEWMAQVEA